jgi:hypothetical protein
MKRILWEPCYVTEAFNSENFTIGETTVEIIFLSFKQISLWISLLPYIEVLSYVRGIIKHLECKDNDGWGTFAWWQSNNGVLNNYFKLF